MKKQDNTAILIIGIILSALIIIRTIQLIMIIRGKHCCKKFGKAKPYKDIIDFDDEEDDEDDDYMEDTADTNHTPVSEYDDNASSPGKTCKM